MGAVVVLEWSFSPPDYFEVPISIARDDVADNHSWEGRGNAGFRSI